MLKLVKQAIAVLALIFGSTVQATSAFDPVSQRISQGQMLLARSPVQALHEALRNETTLKDSVSKESQLSLALSYWLAAAALYDLGEPNNALSYNSRGLLIVNRSASSSLLRAYLVLGRADIEAALKDTQSYIKDYQYAHLLFRRVGDARGQALALQNIAASYLDAGDYATALRYCREAVSIYEADPGMNISAYTNTGIAFAGLGRFRESEKSYEKALSAAKETGNKRLILQVLVNLAQSQISSDDVDLAKSTAYTGLALSSSGEAAYWRPSLYGILAKIALQQGNLGQARDLIEYAFNLLKRFKNVNSLRDLHEVAYKVYVAEGDSAKALAHLEAYKSLDDQARALAASTNAALMSARFDFANQDLKITRLRAGQAEKDAALARTEGQFHSMLLSGLAFITVLLALGFVSIRRSRNQVRAANRELQGTNADLEKALAAKGEFLATTSHEIRTPLNGILGMTQVLLADRAVEPDVRARVQLIHGAGETMRALVDDILDMAKMERGELRLHPAPMDLRRLLEETAAVWAGQAQTKSIGLALQLDDCPVDIVADEVRLRQIMFNLLSNAIKFTDRGQVRLAAQTETADGGSTEMLVMTVADSGIGIPPDRLAEIFESFRQVDGGVTRRHGGTGLGLAICRSLAHAMGGDVTVASVPGTGSTFTVRLPLERAARSAAAPAEASAAATLAEARLLLLDPNPLAQGILRALLTPQVRALDVVADAEPAAALLDAGGVQHLLADAAAFGFDPAAARRFVAAHPVAHATILWPSPDAGVQAAFAAAPAVQLVAKPIGAPDLLAGLRMGYQGVMADRDIAA